MNRRAAVKVDQRIRLYEQDAVLDVAGDTIRPGGLALTDRALDFCGLPTGARLLDVGCGPAASVEYLMKRHHLTVLGCDLSLTLLRAGQGRGGLPLVQAFGEQLPLASARFDAVLAECTLSLMAAPLALTEFYRVLRPGGYLILSDMYARNSNGMGAIRRLPLDSCLGGALPQADTIARVEQHGFTVRLWEDHTAALKLFTAQLIWAHGSIQQFWCRAASHADAGDIQAAVAQAKPGYYLLVGQKPF